MAEEQPKKRLSAWELRERMKQRNAGRKAAWSGGGGDDNSSSSSDSSDDSSVGPPRPLPTTPRGRSRSNSDEENSGGGKASASSATGRRRGRFKGSTCNSSIHTNATTAMAIEEDGGRNQLPPAFRAVKTTLVKPTVERKAGRRIVTRRHDGKIAESRQKETPQERQTRRASIKSRFEQHNLDNDHSSSKYGAAARLNRKWNNNNNNNNNAASKPQVPDLSSPPPLTKEKPHHLNGAHSSSKSPFKPSAAKLATDSRLHKARTESEASPPTTADTEEESDSGSNSDSGSSKSSISISSSSSNESGSDCEGDVEVDLNDSIDLSKEGKNSKSSNYSNNDDDDDNKSLSLDSIAKSVEVRKQDNTNRNSPGSRGSGTRPPITCSGSLGDMNKSLDLSSHKTRSNQGDINTGASDEQWARFKLLGRIGLGDIEPSSAATTLIRQNVKVLLAIMKKVVALRDEDDNVVDSNHDKMYQMMNRSGEIRTGHLLSEVRETVEIKKTRARYKRDPQSIVLQPMVVEQLEDYVTVISILYRDNPFHNFEHASTVLGAVNKVVSLATAPDDIDYTDIRFITTDPWTHFALAFSALIHDVDHQGVPNATLVKEKAIVATAYKNKSVAEQNSLEIAWTLLMEPSYREMRNALFQSSDELMHFRSLVVTATLATDIADKELAAMRRDRAAEALAVLEDEYMPTTDDIASRKATFVLETLIQVADVSHLMMPFAFYKRWNYKLLRETYNTFLEDRAETDPLDNWWKGEFGFFDFYIIPLAKKLEKCGIDSTAYVENAQNNRKMWEDLGAGLVAGYAKELRAAKKSKTFAASSVSTSVHSELSNSDIEISDTSSSSDEGSFGNDDFDSSSDDSNDNLLSAPLATPVRTLEMVPKDKIKAQHEKNVEKYQGGKSNRRRSRTISPDPTHTRVSVSVTSLVTLETDCSTPTHGKSEELTGGSERGLRTVTGRKTTYRSRAPAPAKKIEPISKSKKLAAPINSTDDRRTKTKKTKKKKATPTKSSVETRSGRSKTVVPEGERRYLQRSKSSSSQKSDTKNEGSGDSRTRKGTRPTPLKSVKKTRSKSLDAGSEHAKTKKERKTKRSVTGKGH